VGPIATQAETLNRLITDRRRTGVAIVALPEEMPVNETATLERELVRDVGMSVDRVLLNGLYPERFSADDEEALESSLDQAEGPARDAVAAALTVRRRSGAQREQMARLDALTRTPVTSLPFLFAPELGVDQLRELAAKIP